jgi:chromosome partitioning protein
MLNAVSPASSRSAQPAPIIASNFSAGYAAPRRLLFASHKGGVGKTVSAVNVAAALGEYGARVLLVDTDPNGGLTAFFGVETPPSHPGLYGIEQRGVSALLAPKLLPNVDLVPYAGDRRPIDFNNLYRSLTEIGRSATHRYDFVIIDTRPAADQMIRRMCQLVDEVIVVFQCHHLAYRTLRDILTELRDARADGAPAQVLGMLLTMVDLSNPRQAQLEAQIRASLGAALLPTEIPFDPAVNEAVMACQPVVHCRHNAPSSWAYRKLAGHLLDLGPASTGIGATAG